MEETRKPVLVELANMLANSWRDPGNLSPEVILERIITCKLNIFPVLEPRLNSPSS